MKCKVAAEEADIEKVRTLEPDAGQVKTVVKMLGKNYPSVRLGLPDSDGHWLTAYRMAGIEGEGVPMHSLMAAQDVLDRMPWAGGRGIVANGLL